MTVNPELKRNRRNEEQSLNHAASSRQLTLGIAWLHDARVWNDEILHVLNCKEKEENSNQTLSISFTKSRAKNLEPV